MNESDRAIVGYIFCKALEFTPKKKELRSEVLSAGCILCTFETASARSVRVVVGQVATETRRKQHSEKISDKQGFPLPLFSLAGLLFYLHTLVRSLSRAVLWWRDASLYDGR